MDGKRREAQGNEGSSRRPFRIRVDASAHIQTGSVHVPAVVHDVSENGLKIEVEEAPPPGQVTVKLPGFPSFSGQIRWRGGRYVGIEFYNPIPFDFLSAWIKAHGSSSGR